MVDWQLSIHFVSRSYIAMLELIVKYIKDVSVLRKLLFATAFLSPQIPEFWGLVIEFATAGKSTASSLTPKQAKALAENIHLLNSSVFDSDEVLFRDILQLQFNPSQPLGIPLISENKTCKLCGSNLLTRKDRPARLVVYDSVRGTLPASHFLKYCSWRICSFTQYYGYYTKDNDDTCKAIYDDDWQSAKYFISSKESIYNGHLDAEIVIGQMSYKQRADIYNYLHQYSKDKHIRYY